MINPNYPRPKHAHYLNSSQFRVHEPVGMQTPSHTVPHPGRITSAPTRGGMPVPRMRPITSTHR